MVRWTTPARALGVAALLTLALVTLTLRPVQAQSHTAEGVQSRAAADWGIHATGWVACLNNKSDAFLVYLDRHLNNVADAPILVNPHSQECGIKGRPSLFGGPADMWVAYDMRPHGDRLAPIIGQVNLTAGSSIFLTPNADLGCSLDGHGVDYYYGCAVGFYGMQNPLIFTLTSKATPPGRGHGPGRP